MKFTKPFLFLLMCMVMCACSDDDEPKLDNAASELLSTSWSGHEISYGDDGTVYKRQVILQFLHSDNGQFIPFDDEGNPREGNNSVSYHFDRNVITFNGAQVGQWTITKLTKKHLEMEAFRPNKSRLILERIF